MKRLRIAQIAPMARPIRPRARDSITHVVWLLTEELVARGHSVTLFAPGDSNTAAALDAIYPRGYIEDSDLWHWRFHETMNAARAFERASEFDVIHSHAYHYALPFTRLVQTPAIHTYHVNMDPDIARAFEGRPETTLVALTNYHRSQLGGDDAMPVIYSGIDVSAMPFRAEPGRYLLFLGRLILQKGAADAIEIAKEVGMPLVMAGPNHEEPEYFAKYVEPWIDDDRITYLGEVGVEVRNRLLADAAALLYPLTHGEPFGLVPIEAMACGTPVAAVALGAIPELVDQGVSGYYADSSRTLVTLMPAVLALERRLVREAAMSRFTYQRMVDDYERLYCNVARAARHSVA